MTDEGAAFVREVRARLDMTQVELGGLIGLSQVTIKRYESGREPVPETVRLSLVFVLGLAERLGLTK